MQFHDLGAMHQTPAAEGHHLRLLLAPPCQGGGPLLGAAQRIHLLTAHDHAAINNTGDDGRQLPRGHRDHGLVQQPEALLDPLLLDQGAALLMYGEGEQVCIAETLADLGGVGCGGVRGFPVTGGLMPQHDRYQQIAPLDAVSPVALYQPLGAAEPSGRAAHFSSECEIYDQPERAAHSAHRFAGVEVRVMGALQATQAVVVAAEHECRRCEQLQVFRSQRSRLIGL